MQELLTSQKMKGISKCILIALIVFISLNCYSTPKYKVVSIDSIVSLELQIIKLERKGKVINLLTTYEADSTFDTLNKHVQKIYKGAKLKLEIIRVSQDKKPFAKLFTIIRNSGNVLVIDGVIYRLSDEYFYSENVSGLYWIKKRKKM